MVNVQMLSELEEVIQYKLVQDRRETIETMWWDRLQVCSPVTLGVTPSMPTCLEHVTLLLAVGIKHSL